MPTKKKLTDLMTFNPMLNPLRGFNVVKNPAPINFNTPLAPMQPSLSSVFKPAPAPAAVPNAVTSGAPVTRAPVNPSGAPVGPQGSTGAAPAAQSPVPAQWRRPDGSIKTPEEIAAEIGGALKGAHGAGDVGKLALDQFGAQNKTAEQLEAEARRINNTRNDIAVGETDPYKVASASGIAYTPAELQAIEKAYAGVYDPALDTAMAKVTAKRDSDAAAADAAARQEEIKLQAEERRKDPYTLNEGDIRYDGEGKVIARGAPKTFAPSAGGGVGAGSGGYVQGANAVVDGWVERLLRSGEDITKAIPGVANQALRSQVMLGLNARRFDSAATAGTLDDVNTLNLLLQNPDLDNISGFIGQTGITSLFGQAKDAKTKFDQIAGMLQLAKAGSIKGQGAVSDYERTVLKDASVVANRGQGDAGFRDALIKIRGALMTSAGLEAPVRITDPSTGESEVQRLSTQEIADFIRDGAVIVYVEE